MSNCVYLKQKLNRSLFCRFYKTPIIIGKCADCQNRKFKEIEGNSTLKKATFRLIEAQSKRFSILNQPLTKCAECGLKNGIELNEVFEGAKRSVSMKHGFVVPLCKKCHERFHNDRSFALKYKRLYQAKYEESHSRADFINLIHHNYL